MEGGEIHRISLQQHERVMDGWTEQLKPQRQHIDLCCAMLCAVC